MILVIITILLLGIFIGVIATSIFFKKKVQDNVMEQINEDFIRKFFQATGRTPSQKQINQVLRKLGK